MGCTLAMCINCYLEVWTIYYLQFTSSLERDIEFNCFSFPPSSLFSSLSPDLFLPLSLLPPPLPSFHPPPLTPTKKKGTTCSRHSPWPGGVASCSQVSGPSWSRLRPASPPTPQSRTISWRRERTTVTCYPAWSSRCPSSTLTRTITWATPPS